MRKAGEGHSGWKERSGGGGEKSGDGRERMRNAPSVLVIDMWLEIAAIGVHAVDVASLT